MPENETTLAEGLTLADIMADEPEADAKQEAQDKAAPAETPVAEAKQDGTEANGKPEAADQTPEPAQQTAEDSSRSQVPQQALHAEREKRREAVAENQALRDQIAQMQGQMQMLAMQQMQANRGPAQPEQQPDIWENPHGFVQRAVEPLAAQMQDYRESTSRMLAEDRHGAEAVDQAYNAMKAALASNPAARFDYQRIMAAQHPYGELVNWHKTQQNIARIGSDPDAWLQAEMTKRLADPVERAKLLAQVQPAAATATQQQSSSAAPVILPASLSRLPTGSNSAGDGEMSGSDIFAYAMRR